jgi:molecular chaperone DnaK (HSP70)
MSAPRFLVGIDLGTTNTALAFVDLESPGAPEPRVFAVPQVVAAGEVEARESLPSFVYFPRPADAERHELSDGIVGVYARDQGAVSPDRQVASAKSWLCHPDVDRTSAILPWGAEPPFISPVEASARVLAHLRDQWNASMAGTRDDWRLERQPVVLAVPASFDEEARELTLTAAAGAGLDDVALLEEPLAAFYAWMGGMRPGDGTERRVGQGALVLVCDVGGGTSDFTMIKAGTAGDESPFERVAVGEHLLLGGDNLDLALAHLLEARLPAGSLGLVQRLALRRGVARAKERLLSAPPCDRLPITVLGAGRTVVGTSLTASLSRQEVEQALLEGFLPLVARDEEPRRDRHAALREMGLPYADDPAITRHLAAFLGEARSEGVPGGARPDAVLFNGGFFTPRLARERVIASISRWFERDGWRPAVLESDSPAAAVALGAARFALARRGLGSRVRAGSARSYYVGLRDGAPGSLLCLLPRGAAEGTSLELAREFEVTANRPVTFPLFSSTHRSDAAGAVISLDRRILHAHAPLTTVLRFGKRSRQVGLAVGLVVTLTETGTLHLECAARATDHRWRLRFQLRGATADATASGSNEERADALVPSERVAAARAAIDAAFAAEADAPPDTLPARLEELLEFGRAAWPLDVIRPLADALLASSAGRRRSASHEARWLNLLGFCLRPGFGATLDDWRIGQARSVYAEGLAFPADVQCQVEWAVLWQRIAGGLKPGQQRELYQRYAGLLERRTARSKHQPVQLQREGWRLLASLEHLSGAERVALGEALLARLARDRSNAACLWALGRFGARTPAHGPVTAVVPPERADAWITRLLSFGVRTRAGAEAVAEMGRLSGDPLRDLREDARREAARRLADAGFETLATPLLVFQPPETRDGLHVFGEALPAGLTVRPASDEH